MVFPLLKSADTLVSFCKFRVQGLFELMQVLCFMKVKLSVKVKLLVPLFLLCICAVSPAKAVSEMTYTVSGGTLNPTYSLTYASFLWCFLSGLQD